MISLLSTVIRAVAMGAANELARGAPNVKSLLDPATYSPPAPVQKEPESEIWLVIKSIVGIVAGLICLALIVNWLFLHNNCYSTHLTTWEQIGLFIFCWLTHKSVEESL